MTGTVSGLKIHAAVYSRQSHAQANGSEVSTADQHAQGERRAREIIDRLPEPHRSGSWVAHYEDLGISAFNGDERPDFTRLLNDCRQGRINMIVVYYISRFSRMEPLDAIPLVTELLNTGVTIVSVNEGEFRKGNIMDLIHLIFRLDAAHQESKNKSIAIKSAKETARRLGGFMGGKAPYGFRLVERIVTNPENGRPVAIRGLETVPAEAEVIRTVVRVVLESMDKPFVTGDKHHPGSFTGIAARLNREHVPTRGSVTGKKTKNSAWSPSVIRRILLDPRIAGFAAEPIYAPAAEGKKPTHVSGYRITRDPETMKPVRLHTPIVDPAEWHEIQAWMKGTNTSNMLTRGQALLTAMGVLFCECGHVMVSSMRGSIADSYICKRPKGVQRAGQHEGSCAISQHRIDDYVARRIFALIQTAEGDPETLDILTEVTKRFARVVEAPQTAGERASLLTARADASQALTELYADRAAGGYRTEIGRKAFLDRETLLAAELGAADARLAALDAAETPTLPIAEWCGEPGSDPIGPGSWWDRADIAARRMFVALFADRITVLKPLPQAARTTPVERRVVITWASSGEQTAAEAA